MESKRFVKVNKPQCPQYDGSNHNNWIINLDTNNLYGWVMNQLLTVGGFQ